MPEDLAADLAPRRETEPRVRVVERGLDAGFLDEIAREVFAACRAHGVGLEQRATQCRFAMLAEAVPRVGRRLRLTLQQTDEQAVDGVFHADMMGLGAVLWQWGEKIAVDETAFVVGQLAGPGTYQCAACGRTTTEYALSFEIEACPCGGTAFRRVD